MRKQNIYVDCSSCGLPVRINAWEIQGRHKRKHHFCSMMCYRSFQSINMRGRGHFFYGKKHSEKTKQKIRNAVINRVPSMLGKKHSDASKLKMRLAKLGKHNPHIGIKQSKETISKRIAKTTGLKRTQEQKDRMRASAKNGSESHSWRGGSCSEYYKLRRSIRWKEWRNMVFERDNYTCQFCGKRGSELHAHHQIPFSWLFKNRPEDIFNIANGVCLCVECHKTTPTFLKSQ